jgi:hypothetical protein
VKVEDRILRMFDQLVANPDGVTIAELTAEQGTSTVMTRGVVRRLREACGQTDTINLVCEPDAADPNGQWLYRLVGKLDDARWWLSNRIGDAESRIRTVQGVTASLARAADGRTAEGKRVRLMDRALTRLVEDLDELTDHHTV